MTGSELETRRAAGNHPLPVEGRDVTVVIPTRALPQRAAVLRRAVRSVLDQETVEVRVVAVVNGGAHDPVLVDWLRNQPRCQVRLRQEPGLATALLEGARLVRTRFIGTLDDDDWLLPGALASRVSLLQSRPEVDAVVTNGLRRERAGDVLHVDIAKVEREPLAALGRVNWLLPGAWTARTDRVVPSLFQGIPEYAECTYLALRLTLDFTTAFLPEPTVVWDTQSVGSRGKSEPYVIGQIAAIRHILELDLPRRARRLYRRKLRRAMHEAADLSLRRKRVSSAWRWHLASLVQPGGYRHFSFTRHLLAALWR